MARKNHRTQPTKVKGNPVPDMSGASDLEDIVIAGVFSYLWHRPLAKPITKHHLQPLSKGGKGTETVPLHKICHDIIHRVFTEKELVKQYCTMELLRAAPELQEFITWVQKKEPEFFSISVRSKRKG